MKTAEQITKSEQKEIKRLKRMQGKGNSSKYFFVLLMLIAIVNILDKFGYEIQTDVCGNLICNKKTSSIGQKKRCCRVV
mgnify:CR=1 FL=1